MSNIAIPAWARQRAQEFLAANDPRRQEGSTHIGLAAWIVSAVAGYIALHEDEPDMTTLQAEGQAMDADDWQPDERTMQLCLDTIDGQKDAFNSYAMEDIKRALEAILPKPDRALAEKIVREEFPNAASENEWALIKVTMAGIRAGRVNP